MKITNEDNMVMMARYPDNYFDLAIVDPPYGIGFDGEVSTMANNNSKKWDNAKGSGYKKKEWDATKPNKKYFDELKRVSKNQIVWGGNYFTDILPVTGGWIVWEKGVPDNMSLSQAELAYNSTLNSVRVCKILWSGFRKCENIKRIHPTQKPVKLYEWLLTNYAKKDYKILDTHLGSGSIAIACHNLGFDLTACELDKEYYDSAMKRIKEHQQQIRLF